MGPSEVKRCPKCGGEMISALLSTQKKLRLETDLKRRLVRLYIGGWALAKGSFYGIVPFCCKNCGYIEFFKEKKGKLATN